MFICFFSAESFWCNSSLLEDIFAKCCCRYAFVYVNCLKADMSATEACEKFYTASLRLFSFTTFPVKPCC